jgi:hypothetical protein
LETSYAHKVIVVDTLYGLVKCKLEGVEWWNVCIDVQLYVHVHEDQQGVYCTVHCTVSCRTECIVSRDDTDAYQPTHHNFCFPILLTAVLVYIAYYKDDFHLRRIAADVILPLSSIELERRPWRAPSQPHRCPRRLLPLLSAQRSLFLHHISLLQHIYGNIQPNARYDETSGKWFVGLLSFC